VDKNKRLDYLQAMGIQVWLQKSNSVSNSYASEQSESTSVQVSDQPKLDAVRIEFEKRDSPVADKKCDVNWSDLKQQVAACTTCSLHETRKQTVFGSGSYNASWMVIGEAPGASEDQQGKPFVGRAGQLLTEMLKALGLQRDEVFIANILKCRPPQNRDPRPIEVDSCEGFLRQQVALLKPKIILAAGRVAAQNLLKTDAPLARLRGKVHYYQDIPVIVVYHPAYLLRSPLEKRKAWVDLLLALRTFDGERGN